MQFELESRNTLIPASKASISLLYVIAGTILLAISAKIQIPFFPVPLTMQTFVVLLIGFAFGWRLGGLTVLAYLAEGAAGLPVFAGTPEKGIGIAYMAGPTGGYLLGFLAAAVVTGFLAEKRWDRTWLGAAAAALIGLTVIYAFGLLWLGTVAGWDKPVLEWGLLPFLPGEALKLFLLGAVLPLAWKFFPGK
ncbi:MAG: biotin transporter BioY [Hyphomicrobiales bacterium]|nr:biotin transporter BioY [Hyphomicrobiales bacterium]MCY4049467.1 biotin transporter BioY [Hyphomicrobiales bacterium]